MTANARHAGPAARAQGPGLGLALLLLWILAVLLACAGLGNVALRDWDEAIAARVALELSRQPAGAGMLLPTIWDAPYLNKPPGLHLLIAGAIRLWHVLAAPGDSALPPAWLVRLVPALLSSLVVPLTGLIQQELRPRDRLSPLLAALVMLTLLPIARHGRMAMLDGSQLSAMALLWLSLLRCRRGSGGDWRWAITAGLSGSGMLLLKAPLLLPALAAGLLALRLDPQARSIPWGRLSGLLLLGLLPGLGWHLFHLAMRGEAALHLWLGDGAVRVLTDAGEGSAQGWRIPVLEMLEGGWPWLLFWPFGLGLCWRQRRQPEGSWPLVLQGMMALAILPLRTQLPWYSHPLWLPAALLISSALAWLIRSDQPARAPAPPAPAVLRRVPLLIALLGLALLLVGAIAAAQPPPLQSYSPYLLASGVGWLLGGTALSAGGVQRRASGSLLIAAGNGLALALLMGGPHWNWELAERWAVQPVADLVVRHGPAEVWIWREGSRPSLNWYAQRPIRRLRTPLAEPRLTERWVLSRDQDRHQLPAACAPVDRAGEWQLLQCRP